MNENNLRIVRHRTFLLIAIFSIVFLSGCVNLHIENNATTTTSTTTTTQPSSQILTIKVFLDTESGRGLPFFDNATIEAVRNGMRVWEEKTNNTVSFVETNKRYDAIVTINWTRTFGGEWAGVTYYIPGRIGGAITLMPSGVLLRNQLRAMHELGHVFGLNHSIDVMSVMNQYEHYFSNVTDEDAQQVIDIVRNYQK